jgi:hypothetical protein
MAVVIHRIGRVDALESRAVISRRLIEQAPQCKI